MKKLVLKLDVNDEQVLNIALGRIARISGNYKINMDKTTRLCTVTGDNIDQIQIVGELRMLCPVDIVAVEPPEEPEKKKEELVEEVVNVSSLAAAVGPSKEPKKEDELRKEEPTKQEELVEEVVNASSRAAAAGPSKEPKKKEEELEEEEQKKQEEKEKGEELATDVKEDPNKTFRALQMKKAVFKLELHDEKDKKKAMKIVCGFSGVDSLSMDFKDKKLTVIGDIDPVHIVAKLRKLCHTDIISVGPAKEPAKKKDEAKKEEQKKKDPADPVAHYLSYYPQTRPYSVVTSAEEDPNACVIS